MCPLSTRDLVMENLENILVFSTITLKLYIFQSFKGICTTGVIFLHGLGRLACSGIVITIIIKKLRYKSLCIEIQRMWNLKCTNVPEINWSHWNSNEKLKEKFGSCTRKKFDRFTTKDSYTWNITHNTESTAV